MSLPLSSAALQNRLTAGLCHCVYTYEDLLFTQVCSDPPGMHCSTAQGRMSLRKKNLLTHATQALPVV